jgi:error-prone DNA polymerase
VKAKGFAHLHVHSPFSFLDGASRIEDLVQRAAELGQPALALTDHNNLSGAVRFTRVARTAGIKPILGAEVILEGGYHLTLLARDSRGYRSLCRLLTQSHLRHSRGYPAASWESLSAHREGLVALSGCRRGAVSARILAGRLAEARASAERLLGIFGRENFYLELIPGLLPGDRSLHQALAELGATLNIRLVITGDVHYARKADFYLHDLFTCVRTLTTVSALHPERPLNAENYLKAGEELMALLPEFTWAMAETAALAAELEPSLPEGEALFPRFPTPPGETAAEMLRRLTYEGAQRRYGRLTATLNERLERELAVISSLGFADYFLVVWDVVREAKERRIRCAGRGSAADSVVSYCLGITEVDAFQRELLFERFMSRERAERPDIDLDIDARYRDDLADYLTRRYGADKVAAVATYSTFQGRSAVRDLGKALELEETELDALAKRLPYFVTADGIRAARERVPELKNSSLPWERYEQLLDFCAAAAGLPRHLGTHLGGLVVAREPLANLVPLQRAAKGVVVTQFDKDDVEDLGLVKLDLLSLRTFGAVEESLRTLRTSGQPLDYDRLPLDDKATFRMLQKGRTIGIFQLESPAQRALQSRLGASNMEDIVASLALIRPGPIKGNMVEPYIARRRGEEEVSYLLPALRPVLEKTYGVVLFQEQVIAIATIVAGFGAGEADRLRRVMTHARSQAEMAAIGREFVARAVARGVAEETAQAIFATIAGYASYGFCEAHAAAFATTAYKTAYLLCHHPAHYLAALLSLQPMGFYPPWVLVGEARRRGVQVLPPDVNKSAAQYTVEGGAVRVGLKQIKGVDEKVLKELLAARSNRPYTSLADLKERSGLSADLRERFILSGACSAFGSNRRALLWEDKLGRKGAAVADFSQTDKILLEWDIMGFSPSGHPLSCLRPRLREQGIRSICDVLRLSRGREVQVAGLPIRPHRPPTRSGRTVAFFSLEDETGILDVTVFEDVYRRDGQMLFSGTPGPLLVQGHVERRGAGVSVTAARIQALTKITPGTAYQE